MSDLVKVETTVTISLKGGDYNLTEAEAIELRDALNAAFPVPRPAITFPEGVRTPDPRPRRPNIPLKPFQPNDFPMPEPWKFPPDYIWPTTPNTPTWEPRIFCGTSSELTKSLSLKDDDFSKGAYL